jgi:hypothetical protein
MKAKEIWLDDMELRLKRAYLDLADLSDEEGQRFLTQEIASHLEDVPGEAARMDYLLSLRERFPALLSHEKGNQQPIVLQVPKDAPQSLEPNLEQALEILQANWQTIDQATKDALQHTLFPDKQQLVERPQKVVKPTQAASAEIASDELIRFLKLPADAEITSERLQDTVLLLLKTISQVDALATQVFRQMGLTRDLGQADLRKATGAYLSGMEHGSPEITEMIDETRRKVALIISSIAGLGPSFAQTFLARFQPHNIEQAAGSGGLLRGKESACWKKYVSMADDFHPTKIEKAINDHLIKNLKRLQRD